MNPKPLDQEDTIANRERWASVYLHLADHYRNDPGFPLAVADWEGCWAGHRFRARELAYDHAEHMKADRARMWRALSYVQPRRTGPGHEPAPLKGWDPK